MRTRRSRTHRTNIFNRIKTFRPFFQDFRLWHQFQITLSGQIVMTVDVIRYKHIHTQDIDKDEFPFLNLEA